MVHPFPFFVPDVERNGAQGPAIIEGARLQEVHPWAWNLPVAQGDGAAGRFARLLVWVPIIFSRRDVDTVERGHHEAWRSAYPDLFFKECAREWIFNNWCCSSFWISFTICHSSSFIVF